MEAMFARHGSSWRMVLYCDGITPGSILKPDVRKKVVVLYASYLECGPLLSNKNFWLPVGLIRENVIKQVPGNLSLITCSVLRHIFLENYALQTIGILSNIGASQKPEFGFTQFHTILVDEGALNEILGIKELLALCLMAFNLVSINPRRYQGNLLVVNGFQAVMLR